MPRSVTIQSLPVAFEMMKAMQDEGLGTRLDFARTSIGVAVRAGITKPDIASVDAFKRALLSARSVGYTDPARGGTSGVYLAGVIERLGIGAELKPKTRLAAGIPALIEAIANGDIEIGILEISEIVPDSRLALVGPLPPGLEKATVIAAGVMTNSAHPEVSRALLRFLNSQEAVAVIRASGMEPMRRVAGGLGHGVLYFQGCLNWVVNDRLWPDSKMRTEAFSGDKLP